MVTLEAKEIKQQKSLINLWGITFMIAFPLLITLGLLMRLRQGELTTTSDNDFYMYMTLHGLGMISVLFSTAFAGIWYLVGSRYVKLNNILGFVIYFMILIGVIILAYATLVGKFGAGWYVLYPLPFIGTFWQSSATTLTIVALLIAGVAWLVGFLHILYAMAKEYGGFTNLLGWQYLKKDDTNRKEIPVLIMIAAIATIPGIFAVIAGAILLVMYLMQVFEPSLVFDAITMKNLVMFFGHTIANMTMYLCVGWVYHLLPEFTGRKIKMNKVLVYSWNATFFFICFAFFHHMYMDFVQPVSYQIIGQIASYASPIPASGITMFTVISQLYRAKLKWGIVPAMFLIGTAGWAIGGVAAVVDSTIAINTVLHNTMWVPAHFHTYMLLGVIPFIIGFLYYITSDKDNRHGDMIGKFGFGVFSLGGIGFLLMFYLGGMNSVPRRYSSYQFFIDANHTELTSVAESGIAYAKFASYSVIVLLAGLALMYLSILLRLVKKGSKQEYIAEIE